MIWASGKCYEHSYFCLFVKNIISPSDRCVNLIVDYFLFQSVDVFFMMPRYSYHSHVIGWRQVAFLLHVPPSCRDPGFSISYKLILSLDASQRIKNNLNPAPEKCKNNAIKCWKDKHTQQQLIKDR